MSVSFIMTVSMEQLELHANNGSSGNTDNGHVGGANASVISNGRNVIPTSTTTGSGNGTTNGVRISNGVNATNNNMIDAQTKVSSSRRCSRPDSSSRPGRSAGS